MADRTTKTITAGVVIAAVLAVYGFAADTAGLATFFGFQGWDLTPEPSATATTAAPADPAADPTTPPPTKSTKKPRLTAEPHSEPEPQPVDDTPTRKVAKPKGSPRGVALSGSDRSTEVVKSPNGCSMGRCTFLKDAVAIGDRSFTTGWTIKCTIGCSTDEWIGVNLALDGGYSRLNATLGIKNSTSPDHPLTLEVINVADDEVLVREELTYGKAHTLEDFSVSGIVTLQIRFSGALGRTHGAVGAPVLYR